MNAHTLTEKQILQYAIKGIKSDISELEKIIHQGQKYLSEYANGKQPKTTKSVEEIKTIIAEKQIEIDKLENIRFNLSWQVDVEMEK